jgi:23S rRNA (cytidine1920-2'-O)/16S rRNA (cytidine1409-2'-O)-methyltransferase
LHQTILQELSSFIEKQTLLSLRGATWSPLKGPKGNIEFLFFLQKGKKDESLHTDFTQIVAESHKALDEK